jgi:hypothetical protein
LGYDIAECGNVDLVGIELFTDKHRQPGRLCNKLLLVIFIELKYLGDVFTVRNKYEPWVVGILHQQKIAQWESADNKAVIQELWVNINIAA